MTILKEYVEALHNDRAEGYREAQAYYEGTVLEHFSLGSVALRRAVRATSHFGQHNYCRVIVEAVLNRLDVANIVSPHEAAQAKVTEVWENNELAQEANLIHRGALEYGDAYALVWPDGDGNLQVSYNSPLTTSIVYDPENPRRKLYAVKMWRADEKTARLNVYTVDAIYKYSAQTQEVSVGTNWNTLAVEENPFGEIPVFHFRTDRPFGRPEHASAYGPQNDINKLLATHMYTVDYQGLPQRYALAYSGDETTVDFNDEDTERENIGSLTNEAGNLWYLKGVSNVGEFKPANPAVFWEPIESLKRSLSALTGTPFHFLERSFNVPSGEALRVAEAPLQKKVHDRQTSFAVTWREMFRFILKVEGLNPANLEVKWNIVESMDTINEWDVMLKKINAGLSHRQALREAGYEEKEIDRILAERLEELKAAQEVKAGADAFYDRTARTSTDDNENFGNRNGLTEGAKDNGGRGEPSAA